MFFPKKLLRGAFSLPATGDVQRIRQRVGTHTVNRVNVINEIVKNRRGETAHQPGEGFRGSGGCRKVRWSAKGRGKRGGVRVIYFNRLADGTVWLMAMYAKNVQKDIDAKILAKIKETIDGKTQR